ncbi:unnamed protein product [Candidula unifasciata]|uniref:HTH CENPB-type domain-containing protein n=1 Tax=Candidula unifasciata TaxID=100452 RepID=A0A8S3YVX2_9EUPU|nr:unnamed protein product [Candidula unifasciata]
MEHMEQRLIAWVEEQNENNVSITNSVVKEMAKQLYEDLRKSSAYIDVKPFSASCGWFDRFKRRHGLTSFSKSKTVDENSDTVSRSSIMGHMEQRLISWLEEQNENNVRVTNSTVKDMAKQLYEDLQKSNPDVDAKPFNASCGWFDRFKRRHGFTSFTNKSKTVDENCTLDNFMDAFRALINENSYSPKQVFNLQETELFWKRMPSKMFLSTDQESGIKSQNDHCTLLLGGNAAGDYRIKPLLVCHTDAPTVLLGSSEAHLPVIWRSSNTGFITAKIFGDYFVSQLHQELKAYCENEGLPFKILLLLDMDLAYPPNLVDLSNNIRVLFLPTKIPASIQPMDQGVITMFKSCYFHQLFTKLISGTEVKGESFATDFLNSFDLKMAIDVIAEAWTQLSEQVMREAWRQIWPEILEDSENYLINGDINGVRLSILDMAKAAGFTEVDERDVEDLIESHSFERSNDNSQEIKIEHEETGDSTSGSDQQIKEEHQIGTWNSASDSDQQIKEEHQIRIGNSASNNESVRTLSTETLFQICHLGDQMISLIDENDPDRERSSQVAIHFQNVLACYRELYREKIEHADHISANTFSIKYE